MRSRWLLTMGPSNEPIWVRLYLQPLGDEWAAIIVGDTTMSQSGKVRRSGLSAYGTEAAIQNRLRG